MAIPFVLALIISVFYDKLKDNKTVRKAFAGIRPLAIGIVAAACLSVAETALTSLSSILFVGVGLLLVTKAKATPIVTVVICGVLGGVVYTLFPVLATI